jgi:hypothetical protein
MEPRSGSFRKWQAWIDFPTVLLLARHSAAAVAAVGSFWLVSRLLVWVLPSEARLRSALASAEGIAVVSVLSVLGVNALAVLAKATLGAYIRSRTRAEHNSPFGGWFGFPTLSGVARLAGAVLAALSSFQLISLLLVWSLPSSASRVVSAIHAIKSAVLLLIPYAYAFAFGFGMTKVDYPAPTDTKGRPPLAQRQGGAGWILSYGASLAGTIVTFELLQRATATNDSASKALIYVAAFLLGLEVLFMLAKRVWDSEIQVALSGVGSPNSG